MGYIGTGLALCIVSQCTNHTGLALCIDTSISYFVHGLPFLIELYFFVTFFVDQLGLVGSRYNIRVNVAV